MTDFIYISEIRWPTFRQYCQPFPWRFLRRPRILFVEPPISSSQKFNPYLQTCSQDNVTTEELTVLRLVLPLRCNQEVGYGSRQVQPVYNELLAEYLCDQAYTSPVVWLATPTGLEVAASINYMLLVYDPRHLRAVRETLRENFDAQVVGESGRRLPEGYTNYPLETICLPHSLISTSDLN